ncbi:hypothetical protein ACHHYP_20458 [Achlya hypogyna]|uniref:WRKY19-like zinc finger domain-containing protein n=1 Tax=Achlya hypogyna TaxID=1202772 RepID=A0A1V9ZIU0_ACHHY|nr:hypothetical protein ACHHYP_20458 [Achlya hypogyna]
MRCYFQDCPHTVTDGSWRCHFHRHRLKCSVESCRNQVYARGRCVRHGAKPLCQFESCKTNVRYGKFCAKHGGGKRRGVCVEPGCANQAQARQRCIRHGGGRHCRADGCLKYARTNGLCTRHGRLFSSLLKKPADDTFEWNWIVETMAPGEQPFYAIADGLGDDSNAWIDHAILDDLSRIDL